MKSREKLVRRVITVLGAIAVGCGRPSSPFTDDDMIAVERAAITSLFLTYEHPQQLVFWRGTPRTSPVFEDVALGDSLSESPVAIESLKLPLPVSSIDERGLEDFFRSHADAWENWFRLRAGSGGIVEATAPVRQSNNEAVVTIGRRCGEHCRSAWRVCVVKSASGEWTTRQIQSLALPRL